MELLDFPDEILLKILKKLPNEDNFCRVALICKRFQQLTEDSGLINHFSLQDIDEYVLEDVQKVLERSNQIRSLEIANCQESTESLINSVLKSNLNLQTLYIEQFRGNYSLSTKCMENLVLKAGKSLKNLEIVGYTCDENVLMQVTKLPNLHKLLLNVRGMVSSDHLRKLGRNCKQLAVLFIEDISHISEEAFIHFFHERKDTLERFGFSISTCNAFTEFSTIGTVKNLKHIVLGGYYPSMNCKLTEIFSNITSVPSLRTFELNLISIELKNAIEALSNGSRLNLEEIEFYLGIMNEDQFSKILKSCPNLKRFLLKSFDLTHISDEFLHGAEENGVELVIEEARRRKLERFRRCKLPKILHELEPKSKKAKLSTPNAE